MSCECHMSRRIITSVVLLVLAAFLFSATMPQPEIVADASPSAKVSDEAALVQKDVLMHRRADSSDSELFGENPMDYLTNDAKDFLRENPKMVNALKKMKPTAKEQQEIEANQAEFTEVVNNRGLEYAKPQLEKMQKMQQAKGMSVMKPSIAVAKAYKDLQTGLWGDTRELTANRFEHTMGISMDDVDGVVEDMEGKQVNMVKSRAEHEEKVRVQMNLEENEKAAKARNGGKAPAKKVQKKKVAKAPVLQKTAPTTPVATQLNEKTSVKHAAKKESTKKKEVAADSDEDSGSVKLTASMGLSLLLLALAAH